MKKLQNQKRPVIPILVSLFLILGFFIILGFFLTSGFFYRNILGWASKKGNTAPTTGLPRCLKPMYNNPLLTDYVTYLEANSNVVRAMNPCKLNEKALNWFLKKLESAELTGQPPDVQLPQDLIDSLPLKGSVMLDQNLIDEIIGAKIAGILYIEVHKMLPWSIANYDSKYLTALFELPIPTNGYYDIIDHSPKEAWNVINDKIDLDSITDPKGAMGELLIHMREFMHGGTYYDANGNMLYSTSVGVPTLAQMAQDGLSRDGCWTTSDYLIYLAYAINIPGERIIDYYDRSGHASAIFEMTDQVLAHGDNPYGGYFGNTPSPEVFDSYARWKQEVLRYKPGDPTGAYNSQKHQYEMYRKYPSSNLMKNYCNPSSGTGRDYLNKIFGTYATPEQLDELEIKIDEITNGCTQIPRNNPDSLPPQCNDNKDNDKDGLIDLNDKGCISEEDYDETNCGDGVCEGAERCFSCPSDCGNCSTCYDKDNDISPGIKGSVSGIQGVTAFVYQDECQDGSNLKEWHCVGTLPEATVIDCGKDWTECTNGACS